MYKKWALFSMVWFVLFIENKFWIAPWGDGFISEGTGKTFWVALQGDEFIWFTPGDFCMLKSRYVVLDL